MPRGQFDGLRLELVDGERVHVYGRPELYEQRGDFHLRVLTIERYGLGAHLASLERLKAKLAAEGLFAAERKRPLPRIPRLIGLVTGNDAAAKRDVLTAITTRFPPARIVVAETFVQGPRAAPSIVDRDRRPLRARRRRRDRRPRRRQLRGSAPVLRRAPRARGRRLPRPGRERRRPRAGHAARGSRRRRPRLDPVGGRAARRPRPRRARRAGSSVPARASGGAPGGSSSSAPSGSRPPHERLAPRTASLALERRGARLEATHGRLQALSPRSTLDRGYAIVRAGDSLVRELPAAGHRARDRSGGRLVRSARRMSEPELTLRAEPGRARADRRAAGARRRRARGADPALGARRGALPPLRRAALDGPGQDRGARQAPRRRERIG